MLFCLIVGFGNLHGQSYKQLCTSYKSLQEKGQQGPCFETGQQLLRNHATELARNPLWKAEIENDNGDYYLQHSLFDSAIYCYSRAVNLVYSVKADTSFEYGYYLYNLAYAAGTAGYYDKAEQYYAASLPLLAEFLGASSKEYTMLYRAYVEMKIDMGDYAAAQPMNDALLHYYKTLKGDRDPDYLRCLNNKARLLQGQGDYTAALPVFLEALDKRLGMPAGDTAGVATLYNNAGECYRMMGDYGSAEAMYAEAYKLESAFSGEKQESLATLLNNMALLYKAQSDYARAESFFLKSLDLYKAAGYEQSLEYANPLNNLGDLYRLTGNYKAAVSCISQAVNIRKATSGENHEYYANALTNLALLKMDFDYLDDAESLLLQSEKIYRSKLGEDNRRYANCLNNLAALYARKADYPKALDYRNRCLQLMEKSGAAATDRYALYLSGKASVECDMKDYPAAIASFRQAAGIFKSNFGEKNFNYTDMLFSIAAVYELAGNTKEASHYYLRSMGAYQNIIADNFVSMSENEKTNFYYTLSSRFETFYNYVITLSSKPGFRNDSLLRTLLDVRLAEKSLLLNESRRINSALLHEADTATANLFSRWLQQKRYLQELYKYSLSELAQNNIDLDAEESVKNTLEKALSSSSTAFRKAAEQKNNLVALAERLTKKDLAVEVIRTATVDKRGREQVRYAALLLKKNDAAPKLVALDSCAYFDTLFLNHYRQCINDTVPDLLSYNRFFKALQPYTGSASNLYFSGDGVYQKLNLYTLYDPLANTYLLENLHVTQLNSLRDLLDSKTQRSDTGLAVLFGFPDYALKSHDSLATEPLLASRAVFSDIPELPGTKRETEEIAGMLARYEQPVALYLGASASEEQVKALESPSILHIATHGFFLPDEESHEDKTLGFATEQTRQNPLLRSGLLMAGAGAEHNSLPGHDDGILTAYEASLLNLQNTDLVTLSACETGLGDVVNGQGVYGLQRAFLTAGARSVVMSLWTVDDDATQLLMTTFYREYLQHKLQEGKREALRRAQLEVKKRYPHPYYWGAFVMTGN